MTLTFHRYRSSEGCSSSGTEPSLLGHNRCLMLISTKKEPQIVSKARRPKPRSMPSPRGDEPPPRVCQPNERQEPSRRVSPAPIDPARRRGRPVQSVAESVSLSGESQYFMKDSTMRIAQIAPLYESVPPKLYGGTERVVACLSDALVQRGHEVVLFATGDSKTLAEVVPCREIALRLDKKLSWDIPAHLAMLAEVRKRASDFDILHFHLDCFHLPFSRT